MMRKKTIGNSLTGNNATHQHRSHRNWKKGVILGVCVIAGFLIVCCFSLMVGWYNLIALNGSSTIPAKKTASVDNQRRSSASSSSTIDAVKAEFYERYGGQKAAMELFQRGVQSFGSVEHTAARMLMAAAATTGDHNDNNFVLSFAGYSVTVGRGNHLHQSYPFVLERILKPVLQQELGVTITVRNAAIGGIPSYPYGFCFDHFLGLDADVISWDYSMNEGKGAAVLESYIRQSQSQLPNRPMLILLDTNPQRCKLVKEYAAAGLIRDGLCVGMAKDAVANKKLLELPDDEKPPGFQHWEEFGAPANCPGRGNWHPKKMEHELIGWMMAMYFVEAIAVAKRMSVADAAWKTTFQRKKESQQPLLEFPKPMETTPVNDAAVTDLLYGHAADGGSSTTTTYTIKQLSCRTNFLPATDQDKTLPSIVVAGLAPGITADNIMEERSGDVYKSGWVLDVSAVERDTKVKVEQCGGLGYVDMKIALYGIPESGPLRLWLPTTSMHEHDADGSMSAHRWFDELIICEANEKRKAGACQLDTDIEYTVGGVAVHTAQMVSGAAEYLKRQTCVHVGIPDGAVVTKLSDVPSMDGGGKLTAEAKRRLVGNDENFGNDHIGLIVDLQAKSNVSKDQGACCVSHVVWEQH